MSPSTSTGSPEARVTWPYTDFGPPGQVVERKTIADLDTTFVRFANGVRLTVHPSTLREGDHLPLEVIVSPHRALVAPLVNYIWTLHQQRPDLTLTVAVPEIMSRHWWHRFLHDRIARRLRRTLGALTSLKPASANTWTAPTYSSFQVISRPGWGRIA